MSKLLREGIRRYLKSAILWLSVIATIGISVLGSIRIRQDGIFDDIYIIAEWVVFSVLNPLMIGIQFNEGIFRNKVISGHSKTSIYFSEVILGVCSTIVLFSLSTVIYMLIATNTLAAFPAGILVKLLVGMLLINISFSIICIFISTLIPHKAFAPIICILLVFGLMAGVYQLDSAINQPQYFHEETFNSETGEWIQTDKKIENHRYIDGFQREIYSIAINTIPHGQMSNYMEIIHSHTYSHISCPEEDNSFNKEELSKINSYPMYPAVLIMLFTAVGYICFRKKELR